MKSKWQNFRRTPDSISNKAARIEAEQVIVAAVKQITASDLRAGVYQHLGMAHDETGPTFPEQVMPHPMAGKFSQWNAHGREIKRTDLPMVTKTFTFEVPNYGDWSNGSQDVYQDREVYQREFIPPAEAELSIALLHTEATGNDPKYTFRFRIEQVLDKRDPEFFAELFEKVNLLQENVGAADVYASDADTAEYLKTITVHWEILPPGERTETLNRILSRFRNPSDELKRKLVERYKLLEKLKPVAYIGGTSGFQRYFGAQFRNDS